MFAAILLIGAAQGLFLAIAIVIAPRRQNSANPYLAALMFAFVLELVNRLGIVSGFISLFPQALSLNWALDFFFGPLVFLYAREMTTVSRRGTTRAALPHLVVPVLVTVFTLILWGSYPAAEFLATIDGSENPALATVEAVLTWASLLSMVLYVSASFMLLRHHRANVATNFSSLEKKSLDWLRNLLGVLAILLLLYTFFVLVGDPSQGLAQVFPLAIVVAVFCIGFLGIRQPAVFDRGIDDQAVFIEAPGVDETPQNAKKYQKSALSESETEAVFDEIERLMGNEQTFQINDLSLPLLADKLNLPSHYVSQAINQGSGSNFFEYVNRWRVEFVKRELGDTANAGNFNILELAMNAGFNSKSAFYTAFKKHTGLTPSGFRKSAKSAGQGAASR